jgi:hypothetical protein
MAPKRCENEYGFAAIIAQWWAIFTLCEGTGTLKTQILFMCKKAAFLWRAL